MLVLSQLVELSWLVLSQLELSWLVFLCGWDVCSLLGWWEVCVPISNWR